MRYNENITLIIIIIIVWYRRKDRGQNNENNNNQKDGTIFKMYSSGWFVLFFFCISFFAPFVKWKKKHQKKNLPNISPWLAYSETM